MKSALVILLISMNLYIVVQASHESSNFKEYVKFLEKQYKHNGFKCALARNELVHNIKNASCALRPTIVKLHDHYVPDHVLVNRCGGSGCAFPYTCIPMDFKMKEFVLHQLKPIGDGLCHVVPVEEHTKCGCGCSVTKEDCNDARVYLEDECKCVCKDVEEMYRCKRLEDMMWDEKECRCKCNYREPCSSGNIWISELCMCGAVEPKMN